MIYGIYLSLNEFCSYCPKFEPKYQKTNVTTPIDKNPKAVTEITCVNEEMCKMLRNRFREEKTI